MKPPCCLTDEELRAYADEHLRYEIEMLLASTAMLTALGQVKNDGPIAWATNNALMNTYAIHARNLIDFLYLRSSGHDRRSDIIIEDYIDASLLATVLPPIPPQLDEAKTKADKQVAHLTLARVEYEKKGKGWRYLVVTHRIMHLLFQLSGHFPESRTSQEFRKIISAPSLGLLEVIPTVIRDEGDDPIGLRLCLSKDVTE